MTSTAASGEDGHVSKDASQNSLATENSTETTTLSRDMYSFTAHAHHPDNICNPISSAKWDLVLSLVCPEPGSSVVDLGAGKAGLLLKLVRIHPTLSLDCHAVDASPLMASAASEACRVCLQEERSGARGSIAVHRMSCEEFLWSRDLAAGADGAGGSRYGVTICVGASHSLGGNLDAAVTALSRLTEPGGWIVIGDIYWRKPPSRAYLDALGVKDPDTYRSHAGNIEIGTDAGLVLNYATTATEDEWDTYEGLYLYGIQRYCHEHAGEPAAEAARARAEAWYEQFLKAGRQFMGFGVYVFRVPKKEDGDESSDDDIANNDDA